MNVRGWFLASAMLVLFALPTSMSLAQEDQGEQSADQDDDRASAFRAVSGAEAEQVPGGMLFIAAYGVVWLLIMGYMWRLGRLHAANAVELAYLTESLKTDED